MISCIDTGCINELSTGHVLCIICIEISEIVNYKRLHKKYLPYDLKHIFIKETLNLNSYFNTYFSTIFVIIYILGT